MEQRYNKGEWGGGVIWRRSITKGRKGRLVWNRGITKEEGEVSLEQRYNKGERGRLVWNRVITKGRGGRGR